MIAFVKAMSFWPRSPVFTCPANARYYTYWITDIKEPSEDECSVRHIPYTYDINWFNPYSIQCSWSISLVCFDLYGFTVCKVGGEGERGKSLVCASRPVFWWSYRLHGNSQVQKVFYRRWRKNKRGNKSKANASMFIFTKDNGFLCPHHSGPHLGVTISWDKTWKSSSLEKSAAIDGKIIVTQKQCYNSLPGWN